MICETATIGAAELSRRTCVDIVFEIVGVVESKNCLRSPELARQLGALRRLRATAAARDQTK